MPTITASDQYKPIVSTTAMTGTLKTSFNPLQIGGDTISGQNFKGLIDEVRVYNRSLTQAEIQSDMAANLVAASAFNGDVATTGQSLLTAAEVQPILTEAQARSKNGQPHQRTTGVARISCSQLRALM